MRFVWTHRANRGRRARRLGAALAFQARGRLLGRRTLATIGERSRMWAELHHAASSKVLYANPPDWAEMQAWRRVLRPGDLFIDVGANVGAYTLWAAERGAHVIAVEPDPGTAGRLAENVALNPYDVEIRCCALADQPGVARLTTGLDTTNRLVVAKGPRGTTGSMQEVAAEALDTLLADRVAAGVKVDVEGAELLVLRGGMRALRERRIRLLQLEWNAASVDLLGQDRTPVAELLAVCGYELCLPDGDGVLHPVGDDPPFGPDVFARPHDR